MGMKVLYMGTPDFAVGALERILDAGYEVVAVVTQPDKARGRSKETQPCPVKACALRHGLTVLQPERIRRPEAVAQLRALAADIYVVAAYGQILPQEVLDIPRYGCVNIHASLLPKYRGAAPIQWALLDGEEKSGVTIMQMDAGVDTGDILLQREVPITDSETGGSLFEKLSAVGAELIVEALPQIEAGALHPVAQDEAHSSHTRMLRKEDGEIDWQRPAAQIERMVRGLDPWPGTYTRLNGRQLKLLGARVAAGDVDASCVGSAAGRAGAPIPGEIIDVRRDGFTVACGRGALEVTELQLEGKRRMRTEEFLRGYALLAGTALG